MAKGIVIGGTLIECSEDICRACSRAVWRARYHARQNGECACGRTQAWQCEGICPGCGYHTAGRTVSLSAPLGSGDGSLTLEDTLTDDSVSPETARKRPA